MWRWHHRSLTVRVTATMVVTIGALLGVAAAAQLELQARYAEQSARMNGRALSETVYGAIHNAMLANDRKSLQETVVAIGERSPEVRVRVYNFSGTVALSSVPTELGQKASTEADYWHGGLRELVPLDADQRIRFYWVEGVQTLGVIRPIENEPVCSTGSCHFHAPTKRLLGSLAVEVSMASSEEALHRTRLLMIGVAGVVVVLITATVLLLMRSLIHQPIQELVHTLNVLASGDYSVRYQGKAKGELGFVGSAVNRMAHELEGANAELLRWAQTLERRVEEKTAELKVAQERVLRVDRMASLGKLAAVVAHEINNPLASVVTYSRLLLRRKGNGPTQDQETRQILDAIASESARCGEIVTNLLAFARTRGGKPQPVRVREVIDRVAFLLKHKMDLSQVTFEAKAAAELPELLLDPAQLEQALLALCVNAIDAMPDGGRLIVEGEPAGPDTLAIVVRDTGVGIPSDVIPHIFEPFFSAQGEESKGLGIGLAVVDSIVASNHGKIEVDSTVGRGTTFRLTFPLVPPAPAPEAESRQGGII